MNCSLPVTILSLADLPRVPTTCHSAQCYLTDLPEIWQKYSPDKSLQQLSLKEQERLENITQTKARERFLAGRTLIRQVLSHYLKIPADNIRLDTSTYGKPYQSHNPDLSFNLSHTGNRFALAICQNGEIRVDIELHKPRKNLFPMAQQILTKTELLWFSELSKEDQILWFYRLWSLKEAFLKAGGIALNLPMARLGFTSKLYVSEWPENLGPAGSWHWKTILGDNLSIAVAIKVLIPSGSTIIDRYLY